MALSPTEEALVRQLLDRQAAIVSLADSESTIISKLGATKVTLSDLPAVAGLNLTDILLLRQGTDDKTTTYQKLQDAILGAAVTPPQFDSTTALATTEFVTRAGLQLNEYVGFSVTTVLDASHVGRLVQVFPTLAGQIITLPLSTTCPSGAVVTILNTGSQVVTIAKQGADVLNSGIGPITNVALGVGDSIQLTKPIDGFWLLFGGSVKAAYSPLFGASLATNGWQKLPSGLIIQSGRATTSTGGPVTVNFPIAFPTERSIAAAPYSGTSGSYLNLNGTPPSLTSFQVSIQNAAGAYIGGTAYWMAVGY